MNYVKPCVLDLRRHISSAVCLNGSGASGLGTCNGGPGVFMYTCSRGNGATEECITGGLAGPGSCYVGESPGSSCGDGSAAQGGPAMCVTGVGA